MDLVVPRGSNALVKHVQNSTRVPVLGHADGVCHVSRRSERRPAEKAVSIVVDSSARINVAALPRLSRPA